MIAVSLATMSSYAQKDESGMALLPDWQKAGVIKSDETSTLLRAGTDDNFWIEHAAASYAGGTGTEADPYLIETLEQLAKLAIDATGKGDDPETILLEGIYFKQTADIDLQGHKLSIGLNGYFAGIYDGDGYSISGFHRDYESTAEKKYMITTNSLFCQMRGATVKNVNIKNSTINIHYTNATNCFSIAGFLAAYVENSVIRNCHVEGEITAELAGKSFTTMYGGIAGYIMNTTIDDCSAQGKITANLKAVNDEADDATYTYLQGGGIVGQALDSKIINCLNQAEVNTTSNGSTQQGLGNRCAGIVAISKNAQVLNCANLGALTASGSNGDFYNTVQIAGIEACAIGGHIENCWNAADLDSEGHLNDFPPQSILCYTDGKTTKKNNYANQEAQNAGGSPEDAPLEESYMKSREFVDLLNKNLPEGGIDWKSQEGDYPALHTVNTVILPQVVGATTDPVAGEYEVRDNASFQFKLTLDAEYDKSTPVVTVNGKELAPNEEGFYVIEKVNTEMVIEVSGIEKNPVANEQIEKDEVSFYTQPGAIVVQAAQNTPVCIYTFQGVMQKSLTVSGTATIPVSKGLYILKIGDKNYKVSVR